MKIIRSKRKTFTIEIKPQEGLIVRAPQNATEDQIQKIIDKHKNWIESRTKKIQERQEILKSVGRLSIDEIKDLAEKALKIIPERVKYYAALLGVTYGRITIRNQKTRWGSCSNRGNLNFNCLLMLAPPEVLDSVVVHELCHLKEMNHSKQFYAEVLRVFPNYWRCHDWLEEHGKIIIARMTGAYSKNTG